MFIMLLLCIIIIILTLIWIAQLCHNFFLLLILFIIIILIIHCYHLFINSTDYNLVSLMLLNETALKGRLLPGSIWGHQ